MTLDRIERLDDWIILRHRPGLQVWCHPDGAPIVTELDAGQRLIWCWSADSTTEQRDQTRKALVRCGWHGLAGEVAIGAVQPGEVERWVREGYLVLLDAPAATRHVIAGIGLEGEHGARLDRRRRRPPGPAGR